MTNRDALGCFLALGSPLVAELVARTDAFGWLCFDLQHGMGDFTDCRADRKRGDGYTGAEGERCGLLSAAGNTLDRADSSALPP